MTAVVFRKKPSNGDKIEETHGRPTEEESLLCATHVAGAADTNIVKL